MDNEASKAVQSTISNKEVRFQLVPPNNHRANAAERAIQTFKHHFISCLSTCDKNFPLHLWCRILPQVQLTLNLLRNSNTIPHISAECHLNGPFDFNSTPLAPFGSYCVIHEPTNVRKSWGKHITSGWYLGPAFNHYRCFRVYVPSTKSERISDMVEFFIQTTKSLLFPMQLQLSKLRLLSPHLLEPPFPTIIAISTQFLTITKSTLSLYPKS